MTTLAGRRIVLGVTGGIAAYKAVEVCRRLVDAGAHVSPVLTDGAQRTYVHRGNWHTGWPPRMGVAPEVAVFDVAPG